MSAEPDKEPDLECMIRNAALRLATAATPEMRREAWTELQSLHERRSPEVIEKMELERGING